MYPYLFKPILKETIWGGDDILKFKRIPSLQQHKHIGESWELSHVEGSYSVVRNGVEEDRSIDKLIRTYGDKLIGEKVMQRYGSRFPLLIKFIDARDSLSVQVHPNDELAAQRHHSFGKTEMWYVVKAAPGASLYCGFSQQIDADEYVRRVKDNTLTDVLKRYEVKEGDVFFLPAGRVHAICAGCFIAEIQQTSDITYRIYDYNRKDAEGNERELHIELAKDAIDYTVYPDYQTHYEVMMNKPVDLVKCKYFTTRLLEADTEITRDFRSVDSFVIYICLEGSLQLTDDAKNNSVLDYGQTILFPATTKSVSLIPSPRAKLLEICIE